MLDVFMETFGLNSIQVFLILFILLMCAVVVLFALIIEHMAKSAWTNAGEAMGLKLSGDSLKNYRLEGTHQGVALQIVARHESETVRTHNSSRTVRAYFVGVNVALSPAWQHFGRVHKKKPATLHEDNAPGIFSALSPNRFDDELSIHLEDKGVMRRIFADPEVREALLKTSTKAGDLKIFNGTLFIEHKKRVLDADLLKGYVDDAITLAKLLESRVASVQTNPGAAPAVASAPLDERVTYW
ncbi:hypothetical protein FRC98_01750 [Lujinxingia vulgaris]|uniref:Uncharacterized protein n=1 Tax=Lujinxingia vulgaris TaxID=2600176 RepID=A0A5C6XCM6_9DELT|nr:hypothetical protein [Lujinxingia vulgaris]TXD39151.1 hypothetical protein FRC98_01750 [Lujinxingia vulgaris]